LGKRRRKEKGLTVEEKEDRKEDGRLGEDAGSEAILSLQVAAAAGCWLLGKREMKERKRESNEGGLCMCDFSSSEKYNTIGKG